MPLGWNKLLITMGFTYVAFEGFEVISQAGDETINPKKNLPKAMLYSVFIVTIIYVLVAFATIISVKAGSPGIDMEPWKWIGQFKERGFGEAVARLMPFGNFFLTLAVIFASTSALNATIFSATRASYALGRDHMLPPFFARISKKRKTPYIALIITGIIIIFVVTFLPTMDVASSASIMFLFLFFLVNICVIKIRRNMSDELEYGFYMPLFPLFPIIAIICQAVLAVWLVHVSPIAWIVAPVWIFSGMAIYHAYSKSHALTTEDEIVVFEEEKAGKDEKYKIMVSIANPDNALNLVQSSYKLCKAKKASVELLHMVEVPRTVPLKDAKKYMLEGKEGIVEMMLYLSLTSPVSTTIRYCRNVARGIVSAVREKKINMLILGWRGKTTHSEFKLGRIIDSTIEQSPCDIIILKDCTQQKYKKILVPVSEGPHTVLALEIAGIMLDKNEGEIVTFTIANEKNKFNVGAFLKENSKKFHIPTKQIKVKIAQSNNIASAILTESNNYDLVVLGRTEDSFLHRFVRPSVSELVAKKCTKPMIMVKAASGLNSWIKRWI